MNVLQSIVDMREDIIKMQRWTSQNLLGNDPNAQLLLQDLSHVRSTLEQMIVEINQS